MKINLVSQNFRPSLASAFSSSRGERGFALISSILIMGLLVMIALGMLSLSTVEVRSSQNSKAMAEAQANARMALMIAIGELQSEVGPDQRITANAGIMELPASNPYEPGNVSDPNSPEVDHANWLGVWDSWKAGGAESAGGDEASHHSTVTGLLNHTGMSASYEPARKNYFRRWLVSAPQNLASDIDFAKQSASGSSVQPVASDTFVKILAEGSLGSDSDALKHISIPLVTITADDGVLTGRYGWWVSDESQKASLMDNPHELAPPVSLPDVLASSHATAAPGLTALAEFAALAGDGKEAQRNKELSSLPTYRSLELLSGLGDSAKNVHPIISENYLNATTRAYSILTDVREGGLKRDLTTLLSRKVDTTETSDEFMLYRFSDADRVPIQDLAAYYQLHDSDPYPWSRGGKEGVVKNSAQQSNAYHITSPEYGASNQFLRAYTSLYRSPVPVKVELVMGIKSVAMTDEEREAYKAADPDFDDTHYLYLAIAPAVTFWNPTNLPMTMNLGNPEQMAQIFRLSELPMFVTLKKDGVETNCPFSLDWATSDSPYKNHRGDGKSVILNGYFSATEPVKFEPGEVKIFSYPYSADLNLEYVSNGANSNLNTFDPKQEFKEGWDPSAFLLLRRSAPAYSGGAYSHRWPNGGKHSKKDLYTFKASDKITFAAGSSNFWGHHDGAYEADISGSGMNFYLAQKSNYNKLGQSQYSHRNYQFMSRPGATHSTDAVDRSNKHFNSDLFELGLDAEHKKLNKRPIGDTYWTQTPEPMIGSDIIAYPLTDGVWPCMHLAMMASCETSEQANGGGFGGRKIPGRPFLHSSPIYPPYIVGYEKTSSYNHGWNWFWRNINGIAEANVQNIGARGFYGGGYTPETGTTHVVQQEIPLVPPASIASLSHAHLGGYSLATGVNQLSQMPTKRPEVTAVGQTGMFPHTLQAIGNSYAHPNIPASQAFKRWDFKFSGAVAAVEAPYVDHSYLANKALYDNYFFSTIRGNSSTAAIYAGNGTNVRDVADAFFFDEKSLSNARLIPYTAELNPTSFNELLAASNLLSKDGFSDQIARHLMVEGGFNVNSTSVPAWKALFMALRERTTARLPYSTAASPGARPVTEKHSDAVVSSFNLPNGEPYSDVGGDPSDARQWTSPRILTDTQIDALAKAMVSQVRLRGPFLSLSEFVNRQLNSSQVELSVKGALQAALDDYDTVTINQDYKTPGRTMSAAEVNDTKPEFPEALEGSVAYGSAGYVDQADILRNLGAQLTPRGDTFVIRAYGDSMSKSGKVVARAWCEAVVQRVPTYLQDTDKPETKQADLTSEANRLYGRALHIVSFRWLSQDEI